MENTSNWKSYLKLKNSTSVSAKISNLIDIRIPLLVFLRNSNLIKLEVFEKLEPKFGKLIWKINLKLEKFIFCELVICLNSKFSSSMKLEFDEIWTRSSTRKQHSRIWQYLKNCDHLILHWLFEFRYSNSSIYKIYEIVITVGDTANYIWYQLTNPNWLHFPGQLLLTQPSQNDWLLTEETFQSS